MNLMKGKLAKWLHETSHIVMLAAFFCAAVCMAAGLTRPPQLYPVDYGQYERIMEDCGLTWTEEDLAEGALQYERPIRRFAYARFPWARLLSPRAGNSITYAVSAVRLVTAPFGLPFTTDALAVFWGLMLASACGVMTSALYRMRLRAWFLPGAVLCMLCTDGNFCAVFRGLYPQGAEIVFALLTLAFTLSAFSRPREGRLRPVLLNVLFSVLFIKAGTGVIVFLPLALAVNGYLLWSCRKTTARRRIVLAVCILMLVCFCRSAEVLARQDPDYFSQASAYESVFNGMLTAADDPENVLAEFDLDETYAADIGKSYYEPEESYVHCPRDAAEAELLFARVTPERIAGVYLKHPDILTRLMLRTDNQLRTSFENARNKEIKTGNGSFSAVRADGGLPAIVWRMLPMGETGFMLLCAAALLCAAVLWAIRKRAGYGLFALAAVCAAMYLPCNAALNGLALSQQYILFQAVLAMMLLTVLLCGAAQILPRIREWMTRYTADAEPVRNRNTVSYRREKERLLSTGPLRAGILTAMNSRTLVTAAAGLAAVMMLVMTFAPETHPVSINNGDFGRMMVQMDLTWNGMQYYDTATQAGRQAIEEFAFTRPFQPLKLTPLEPTYSLYWFVSVTRLLTEPFGKHFSTWVLAWVMGFISVICLLKTIWDLQPLLKRWTVLAAVIGCAMLFSETYLTWYNSLYGEGCILSGLLLTVMCAVHLVMAPQKQKATRQLWLVGLAVSLNILITAKAQMMLAMPGAIGLFLWLSWYHRAWRYDLRILQGILTVALSGMLAFSALAVYETDRTADSVSQKHTMWQAYFYGIFMISDDPIGDMEALGIDTAMAPDIGKFVQFDDDSRYVYAPLSEEAQKAFYDHVSMGTIIQWYLTHPGKLWYMLNYAAGESRELYTGFRVYRGQDYADLKHTAVNGFDLWPSWRDYLTPGSFAGYILFYGVLLFLILRRLFSRRKKLLPEERIRCAVPLFIMVTGVLQYPLSVLGNGFADNQKQLFCFALCNDMLMAGALILGFRQLSRQTVFPRFFRRNPHPENAMSL